MDAHGCHLVIAKPSKFLRPELSFLVLGDWELAQISISGGSASIKWYLSDKNLKIQKFPVELQKRSRSLSEAVTRSYNCIMKHFFNRDLYQFWTPRRKVYVL